jgi:transcriptional regulator with XRE-family HTH domain
VASKKKIGDALRAHYTLQTKDIAKTPQGRFNVLKRAATPKGADSPDTAVLAEQLGVSRRQAQRYVKGEAKIGNAKADTLQRLEDQVRRQHQPRIFAKAQQAAQKSGLIVETRARFGFATTEAGGSDDARLRRLTEGMPDSLIPDIFEALRNDDEERLHELLGKGFGEVYFGEHTPGVDVKFTDIDYIKIW